MLIWNSLASSKYQKRKKISVNLPPCLRASDLLPLWPPKIWLYNHKIQNLSNFNTVEQILVIQWSHSFSILQADDHKEYIMNYINHYKGNIFQYNMKPPSIWMSFPLSSSSTPRKVEHLRGYREIFSAIKKHKGGGGPDECTWYGDGKNIFGDPHKQTHMSFFCHNPNNNTT